jgi:hypothetical protein
MVEENGEEKKKNLRLLDHSGSSCGSASMEYLSQYMSQWTCFSIETIHTCTHTLSLSLSERHMNKFVISRSFFSFEFR